MHAIAVLLIMFGFLGFIVLDGQVYSHALTGVVFGGIALLAVRCFQKHRSQPNERLVSLVLSCLAGTLIVSSAFQLPGAAEYQAQFNAHPVRASKPGGPVDALAFLRSHHEPKAGTYLRVQPSWFVTHQVPYQKPDTLELAYRPATIELNLLCAFREFGEEGVRARLSHLDLDEGLHSGGFYYAPSLPNVEAVRKATSESQLTNLLGPADPRLDGFTLFWNLFTITNGGIRWLKVEWTQGGPVQVDGGMATLTPSLPPPNDREENAKNLHRMAEKRAGYPMPLRSLLEARELHGDHNRQAYKGAVETIRLNPDPILFEQLVICYPKDSIGLSSILEDLLIDKSILFPDRKPWDPTKLKQAQLAIARALPKMDFKQNLPQMELEDVIGVMLQSMGGGSVAVPITDGQVSVTVELLANGKSVSCGSQVHESNFQEACIAARDALLKLIGESVAGTN